MPFPQKQIEALTFEMDSQGWFIADDFFPKDLCHALSTLCRQKWQEGAFTPAHVGRGDTKQRLHQIRGDSILWLEENDPTEAVQSFFVWTDELRKHLNRIYFLSLRETEFHFARYAEGQAYQKHIDQHRGSHERKISFVLYLNPEWPADAGGELAIYSPEDDTRLLCKISPLEGRTAIFRSDLIPHEVLPARLPRWSLTGWFRG